MPRTTFITGASSGIGRALAARLAAQGDRVALAARRTERLHDLSEKIAGGGGIALPLTCDVTDQDAVREAVARCEAELGPVELLVANAGVSRRVKATALEAAAVEQLFRVNFFGAVYCFEAVLPGMIARRQGHLVGISSIASYLGIPGHGAYSASKAALNRLLEAMRIELRAHHVAVTTICPGFVKTDLSAGNPRPMPFLMELDDAAQLIHAAIERQDTEYAFPWPLAAMARATQLVPDRIADPLIETLTMGKKQRLR